MPDKIKAESPFGNESVSMGAGAVYKVFNYGLYFLLLIAAGAAALFAWNTGTEAAGVGDENSATVTIN